MKLAALLLATLWLPATVHCQLEQVGLDTLFACADQAGQPFHDGDKGCTDDGCQTIESGQVALSKSRLAAASLALLACNCHFCLFEIPAPSRAADFFAPPQEQTPPLQRPWQFERRAAPLPGAPSPVIA